MSLILDFRGELNLETGEITRPDGTVMGRRQWQRWTDQQILAVHRENCAQRDLTSDLQNLPGTKPEFVDDWFGVVPEQVQPYWIPSP